MATINTKPKVGRSNKLGDPINVFYFHDGLPYTVSVGESVKPEQFDREKGRVNRKHERHAEINAKIEEIEWRMNKCIRFAKKYAINPTRTFVKERYLIELDEEAKEINEAKEQEKIGKRVNVAAALHNDFEIEDLEEQKRDLEEKLKTLSVSTAYKGFGEVGIRTNSEEKVIGQLVKRYDEWTFVKKQKLAENTMKIFKTFKDVYFTEFPQSKTYKEGCKRFDVSIAPEHMTDTFLTVLLEFYTKEKTGKAGRIGYNDNTIGKHLKTLKEFLGYLEIKGVNVCKEYRGWEHYEEDIEDFIIIGQNSMDEHGNDHDEFELLWEFGTNERWKHTKYNRGIDKFTKVFDLMIVGLMGGIRIEEILENEFIVFHREGKDYLYGKTWKNDSEIMLPMWKDERLLQLLDKYNPQNANLPKSKRVYKMNLCSQKHFNETSKEILRQLYEYHNINQYKIKQTRTQLGKEIDLGEFYKWELFSSRTMRRSAITKWMNDPRWKLSAETVSALIGTKKLAVIEVYRKMDKHEKHKLLKDI